MVLLENASSTIGMFVSTATANVTGDKGLTLLTLVILIVVFGFMFRVPIEWIMIIMIPLIILLMFMTQVIWVIAFIIFVFFAVFIVKVIVQALLQYF